MKRMLRSATTLTAIAALSQPALAASLPLVTTQPDPPADVTPYFVGDTDVRWTGLEWSADDIAALRQKVKYVFVIFNENRSFDHEYGTLPGVNGLYSDGRNPRSPADTPGFTESYLDPNTGETVTAQPFRLGPEQNSTIKDSTDHSHTGLAAKLHVQNGVAKMDKFAEVEWRRYAHSGGAAREAMGKQFARLVMAHIDCDTIPFFWRYASRFAIFDNIFATEDTPSTPNAVAMIAGQSGETQWVKHPGEKQDATQDGFTGPISGTIDGETYSGRATTLGPPLVEDPQPWWDSEFDNTVSGREPAGATGKEWYKSNNIASNLTFATLPLTFMGGWINWFTGQDRNPAFDLPDVTKDIPYIGALGGAPVQWRWYQNGYDHEPTDPGREASHQNYVSHHNGAQYFGYIANNPAEQTNLRGEGDFFSDMANNVLPRTGGVFYIRGGYYNLKYPNDSAVIQNPNYPNKNGLTPTELAAIGTAKSGDDDHPSYSDSQLSEAMAARVINAIAANKDVWEHSAIVIIYDESDGLYDHVPPRILSYGPDGLPIARGIRIPLLLISPYARVHAVSHAEGDHNAVIETINALFGLPALSSPPDEKEALAAGDSPKFNAFGPPGFEQKYLGPRDEESPTTASLLSGFDKARITGALPPLPAPMRRFPRLTLIRFRTMAARGARRSASRRKMYGSVFRMWFRRGSIPCPQRCRRTIELSACKQHAVEHPSRHDASHRSSG
jgi:phospholipase C